MAKEPGPDDDFVGVSLCGNCPHIHLNIQQDGVKISMALDDEDWRFLLDAYHRKLLERAAGEHDGKHIN